MKNKILRRLVSIAGLTALPIMGQAAPDPNFHIYLALGQSNMQGTADIQAQDRGIKNPRVEVMQSENGCFTTPYGSWRPAEAPLIRCNQPGGLGPADTFGQTMAENTPDNIRIGIVGGAYGGASIKYFLKNCSSFGACTPPYGGISGAPNNGNSGGYAWVLDLAQRAQEAGVIKGFIFHQGESDSGDSAWTGQVNQFVTDLRNDLGLSPEESPFIAGELPYTGCCRGHNTLVNQLPNVITNAHVVSAGPENGATLGDKGDSLHWNSESVRIMGRRYAAKMLEVVTLEAVPVDCGQTTSGNNRCCDISADPDGDGWGEQNEGEMCQVDQDTVGWNPPEIVKAINVGSNSGDSFNGVYYSGDEFFAGGTSNSTTDSISGASGSKVMQSERYGTDYSYEIPVDNGSYTVELNLVELYHTTSGSRLFNVSVEGSNISSGNIDLYQLVGHDTLYTPDLVTTSVSDGALSIQVSAAEDNATISGIVVRHAAPPASSSSSSSVSSQSSSSSSSVYSSSSSSSSGSTTGGSSTWFLLALAILSGLVRIRRPVH